MIWLQEGLRSIVQESSCIRSANCSATCSWFCGVEFFINLRESSNEIAILRSNTRHKSRFSHVNVFYAIIEDN